MRGDKGLVEVKDRKEVVWWDMVKWGIKCW